MKDITFFLPTRKGSSRVVNKNTRNFAKVEGGLLAVKLRQLMESKEIAEIVLSTNDEECIRVASQFGDKRLKIIERPEHLCLDTTPLTDLINYVPEVVSSTHVLWGHVTTPMVDGKEYDRIVLKYFEGLTNGFDSLVTVKRLQNFLIDPDLGKVMNAQTHIENRWPRTQDLKLLYEVNHAAFITAIDNYRDINDRVGVNIMFLEQDSIQSIDVDWEDDFRIAEAVYSNLMNG